MEQYNQPPAALGPAKTPVELRLLMLRNNAKFAKKFHYFDFCYVPRQGWYCWFEIKEEDKVRTERGNNK